MHQFYSKDILRPLPHFVWLIVFLFLGFQQNAFARRLNHRSENEWTSTQKASLGNIGALSENFSDQFFSDPSLQARKKEKFGLQILSVNTYFTDDLLTTQSDAMDFISRLQTDGSGTGLSKTVDTLEFVASLTGRRVETGATLQLIGARFGGFTLIPYVNAFAKAHIDVPSWPVAEVIVDQYSGVGFGYSYPLGKAIDLGANLRPGMRIYLQQEVSASSLDVGTSQGGESSSSTGSFEPRMGIFIPLDLAAAYQLNSAIRTHLVMRNVYGGAVANLSGAGESGNVPSAPPDYALQLATGGTWSLIDKGLHKIRLASELQDITAIEGLDSFWLRWQWAGQYLYQLPFRSSTSFGLNAGLQSGYPSIGLLVDLFLVKFEAAMYNFEGGAAAGQDPVRAKSFRVYSELSF